jgi:hypothetical protein
MTTSSDFETFISLGRVSNVKELEGHPVLHFSFFKYVLMFTDVAI